MKTISIELSEESIEQAIKEIEEYKRSLTKKIKILVERLASIGLQTVDTTMLSIAPVDRGDYSVDLVYNAEGNSVQGAVIRLEGDQVLFVEFSAGILFGTDSFPSLPNNPSYGQGYGMGTYPDGKGHWDDPTGWWYIDKWGQAQHTYGVRAYAPMYQAAVAMRNQIHSIAKEVFGG